MGSERLAQCKLIDELWPKPPGLDLDSKFERQIGIVIAGGFPPVRFAVRHPKLDTVCFQSFIEPGKERHTIVFDHRLNNKNFRSRRHEHLGRRWASICWRGADAWTEGQP